MSIYTYESPNSVQRLAHKLVVVDTSYLQHLSDPNEDNFTVILAFHQRANAINTTFLVNTVVRQEFIKLVRKSLLIDAILILSKNDASMEVRYRLATGIRTQPLSPQNLNYSYDRIYKDHVKQGDVHLLLNVSRSDFWHEVQLLENQTSITYLRVHSEETVTWDALGLLMQSTGMAPTDALIANFAFTIGANAILTTDCDFAPIEDLIDVYMPRKVADQCSAYNPALD